MAGKTRRRKKGRRQQKKEARILLLLVLFLAALLGAPRLAPELAGALVAEQVGQRADLEGLAASLADQWFQAEDGADLAGGAGTPPLQIMPSSGSQTPASGEEGTFRAEFLDVGQGLSVLLEADGHYLLYDGGDRDASSFVVAWLRQKGVTHLDYLIASHYDADHINGLVGALHTVTADTILGPDYTADSRVYESFLSAVSDQGKTVSVPEPGQRYFLGNGYFDILAPLSGEYGDANNYSIVIRFVYGDTSLLLSGDAEDQSEQEMLAAWPELKSDILCVGHHGSPSSSSEEFLDRVAPSCAVISCGLDNSYGHPAPKVLERLTERNIPIYRTDENGTVTVNGDGESFTVTLEKGTASAAGLRPQFSVSDRTGNRQRKPVPGFFIRQKVQASALLPPGFNGLIPFITPAPFFPPVPGAPALRTEYRCGWC